MLRRPLAPIEDDTEDAPWMVMGSPQSDAAAKLYTSLQTELRARGSSLYIATFLPIRYQPDPNHRVVILSPDLLVARVPDRARGSYTVAREGVPPELVIEIVSPESSTQDLNFKPDWYAAMGIREYAVFAPETPDGLQLLRPPLQGFRLAPSRDEYERWPADAEGRLYSDVLDLLLVVREAELRAQRPDDSWVLTHEEEHAGRTAEARARAEAESRLRQQAEEIERLRAELKR